VSIYDAGTANDGSVFIAMELVDGTSLDALLARGRLPAAQVSTVLGQVAAAIDAAHAAGIVHRDIKPGNILIDRQWCARLTDFDLALGGAGTTRTQTIAGTPAYMSPEQAEGLEQGPASDIYSFGCVTYELLAGQPPFDAPTAVGRWRQQTTSPPPDIPGLDPPLMAALRRMLATAPADRPASATAGVSPLLRPAAPVAAAGVVSGRDLRMPLSILGAALVVAVLAGGAVAAFGARGGTSSPPMAASAVPASAGTAQRFGGQSGAAESGGSAAETRAQSTPIMSPTSNAPDLNPEPSPRIAPVGAPPPTATVAVTPIPATATAAPTAVPVAVITSALAANAMDPLANRPFSADYQVLGPDCQRAAPGGSTVMLTASAAKLAIAIEVLRQLESGQLDRTRRITIRAQDRVGGSGELPVGASFTAEELLARTLAISSNTGGNLLLDLAGGPGAVNASMARLGLGSLRIERRFMGPRSPTIDNFGSANDLAAAVCRARAGTLISPSLSAQLIALLRERLRPASVDPALDFAWRMGGSRPVTGHINGLLAVGTGVSAARSAVSVVELPSGEFYVLAITTTASTDGASVQAETAMVEANRRLYNAVTVVR
jgi:serine/threonine-protein kinase